MKIELTFLIDLKADYHVGLGQRIGPLVDSALLRDFDNAPVLRGTMIVGLLRDGLRNLFKLPPANHIAEKEAVRERLFGTASSPKRWIFGSARPVTANKTAKRWGATDVTRVRVNPRTRRVSPKKLFIEEEGDQRLQFQFTATCEGATTQDTVDATLLVAAACMVRHLGAARRRGRGHCRIRLVEAQGISTESDDDLTEAVLKLFKSYWFEGKTPGNNDQSQPKLATTARSPAGARRRFKVIARAKEPILIAQRSEAANTFETRPLITGTALLGALASRAARRWQMGEKANPAFITYFLRGGMRLSGLLPAAYLEEDAVLAPAITAPSSLVTCEVYPAFRDTKGGEVESHSYFNLLNEERKRCPDCGNKLVSLTKFLQLSEEILTLKTKQREEAHIQIAQETQRVEGGKLYEYITLEAGQWFVGELDCDANYWQQLQSLTGLKLGDICPLRVGKATRRGYGLIHLVLLDLDEDEPCPWITKSFAERISESDVQENSLTFSLLMLTDTIVTDQWGRFSAGFASSWLAKSLGLKLEQVQIEKQFVAQRHQDGFNTHRRMPRWRDEAITAGSVAEITLRDVDRDILSRLADLEREGIGLRRHEGFGRVAVNHPLLASSPSIDYEITDEDAWIDKLRPDSKPHRLQTDSFISRWTQKLENRRGIWEKMSLPEYEALARLIFLYRHRPLDELLEWLAEEPVNPDDPENERTRLILGQPRHLWGNKSLEVRDHDVRLNKETIREIRRLVASLANEKAEYHALGLQMLAETIATNVRENLR